MKKTTQTALTLANEGWSSPVFDKNRNGYGNDAPTEQRDISFAEIGRLLWRRRFMNVMIVGLFVGAAITLSLKMPKKYQATSEMIVLQAAGPQQSLASANQTTAALLTGATTPLIETPSTQVAMISSLGMAQRTIDYLKNQSLKQNKTLGDLGVDLSPNELMNNIVAVNPKGTNLIDLSVTSDSPESARLLTDAVSQAFVQWKREIAQASVNEMTHNLNVRAQRAHATLLNAEARETQFEKRWQVVDMPEQEKESLTQLYARQSDVAALKQEASAHQVRLAQLSTQLSEANHTIGVGGGVRDDSLILSLQQQLSQAQMETAAAQRKYTAAYPGVLPDLIAHVADLKSRLDRAIGSAAHGDATLQSQSALKDAYQQEQVALAYVQKKLAEATTQRDALIADTARWPELHNQFQRLTNDTEMARTLYASIQSEVSAARSGKDMTTGNVQITQVALLPDMPSSPRIPLNVALGLLLGLTVALVTTLIMQQNDRGVHTVDDAFKLMNGPYIGTIPALTSSEIRDLREGTHDGYGRDAFGLVGVNLMLLGQGNDFEGADNESGLMLTKRVSYPQVILVTSALPGEGKSLVASQVAQAIARSSRSVVLVDADLRRPTQHHLFNTVQREGLINVLSNTATLDSVLTETSTPNMRLIGSGFATSDQVTSPTGLLSQPMMQEVLAQLSASTDVVIIDTPPSAVVPDALYLAPYADHILQVIGIKYSESDAVRQTTDALYRAAPGSLAFVLNRAPRGKNRRYGDKYGYGKKMIVAPLTAAQSRSRSN